MTFVVFFNKILQILSNWIFKDKKNRNICLIPEVTAIIQNIYNTSLKKNAPKPIKLFYITRCYRYDRPQLGRYREFTQVGTEILEANEQQQNENKNLLIKLLNSLNLKFNLIENVQRGLNYYTQNGYECESDILGAQKQIAGGGSYKEGTGWAIGLERLLLALQMQ